MRYTRPPPLRPGDPVAVIAPAGRPPPEDLAAGLALLRERYDVRLARDLGAAAHGMMAGEDGERARELAWALSDPAIRGVLAARGGYGTTRVLEPAMLEPCRAAPRHVVGFSDLTALLSGALAVAGMQAVHGAMVCQIGRRGRDALDPLVALLEGAAPPPVEGLEPLVPGRARGPLVGGNLTLLCHLVGTPLLPDLEGALLFIEDVGERPYRLDRCLTHLQRAGLLERVAAVVVGQLVACASEPPEHDARTVLEACLRPLGLPVALGLPAGHGRPNLPFPLGAEVLLDVDAGTLSF